MSETTPINEIEKRFSSQPAGYLLNKFGLLAIAAVMLLAAWSGQVVIVILLGLVLSAAGLAKLWSRMSLAGVHCQRFLSEHRVFPGEYIDLKLKVVNRKLLPLPWVQVDDEIPVGFVAPDVSLTPGSRPGFGVLSRTASLLWYSGLSWKSRLLCNKRGYYSLGPITTTSGDIFGFYPRWMTEPAVDHIIVYPKIFTLAQLGIPSLYPLGETRAELRIFEDPSRTIGIRAYAPGDSLRRIHWKASARHQSLQVKVFESTTTIKAALFLAIDSFQRTVSYSVFYNEECLELGISTAASVANYLVEQGSQAGLWVNSCLADSGQPVRITPSGGTGQLVYILEALAKVTPFCSTPFRDFVQAERKDFSLGTTLVFILSQLSPSLNILLQDLAETGYKMLVLQIGDEERGGFNSDIVWYNVGHSSDLGGIGVKVGR